MMSSPRVNRHHFSLKSAIPGALRIGHQLLYKFKFRIARRDLRNALMNVGRSRFTSGFGKGMGRWRHPGRRSVAGIPRRVAGVSRAGPGVLLRWATRHGLIRLGVVAAARQGDTQARLFLDPAIRDDPYPFYAGSAKPARSSAAVSCGAPPGTTS